ncbi:hypothetical protein T459_17426 [Capsicum annuum]|uniref:Uncharacterized protein n=1 Tax=Capsicum annuum TaxID=4072 RepID=A0A2G2ZBP6_CAPAN|nr:hypothetical protein T459_17426 [Capsicum annuum]
MSLPVMGRLVASIGLACSAIFQWVFDGGRVYPANFAVMVTGSDILGALQELFASELVARVDAMISATDNAVELKRNLSVAYRQAKITVEVLVIVAGGAVLT